MYIAITNFTTKRGKVINRGDEISDTTYFFLPSKDKVAFIKKGKKHHVPNIGNGKTVHVRRKDITYAEDHSSMRGDERAYMGDLGMFTITELPINDNPVLSSDEPSFGGFGGGETGGAGASGSWESPSVNYTPDTSNYDSGTSSYDSGSYDSGGGDCGGSD